MFRRTPISTLFPYTTLFRSAVVGVVGRMGDGRRETCEARVVIGADGLNSVVARRLDRIERSEEHTSELQSRQYLVCRLLLEKKKKTPHNNIKQAHIDGDPTS